MVNKSSMGQVQFQTSLKEIFKAHTFSQINMFLCFVSNSFTFSLVMVLQVVVVGCDGIFVDMLLFYIVLVLLFWMSFLVFCVLIFWLMFLLVWELLLTVVHFERRLYFPRESGFAKKLQPK